MVRKMVRENGKEQAWNAYVREGLTISIRFFALTHDVKEATWRRELKRGATGALAKVDDGKANMGARMRLTAQMANRLRILIVEERRSPYEKGAVENVNRIIRRWFPKGTDFSKVSREDVLAVEAIVNSIHRLSLKGASAHEYHSRMAKAA